MEADAQRRAFLLRTLALACTTIALASCEYTITGTDEKTLEPEDEGGNGGEGGGY